MPGRHKLTWGEVKSWAEANGVTDDAVLRDDQDGYSVNAIRFEDLSFNPAEPGYPAEFILQHRWG